jgi:hypothetical protein
MNMSDSNYKRNKHTVGVGFYDFFFNVSDLSGDTVIVDGDEIITGKYPRDYSDQITLKRTATFQNDTVIVTMTIWAQTT